MAQKNKQGLQKRQSTLTDDDIKKIIDIVKNISNPGLELEVALSRDFSGEKLKEAYTQAKKIHNMQKI